MTAQTGRRKLTEAAQDVLAERERQISKEGWDSDHDDEHSDGSLAIVAAIYALLSTYSARDRKQHIKIFREGIANGITSLIDELWPRSWDRHWFKPKNPRRDLVRAGALILAEIERLDRITESGRTALAEGGGECLTHSRPSWRAPYRRCNGNAG